jgi:hypothetical protein
MNIEWSRKDAVLIYNSCLFIGLIVTKVVINNNPHNEAGLTHRRNRGGFPQADDGWIMILS